MVVKVWGELPADYLWEDAAEGRGEVLVAGGVILHRQSTGVYQGTGNQKLIKEIGSVI